MTSRIDKSLKAKLSLLFFVLNMAVMAVVGAISYDSTRDALLSQLDNNLTVLSRQTAETVDRFMAERQSDTRAIALHYALFNIKTTTSSQNDVLARYLTIYPYYEQINIINIEDIRLPEGGRENWYVPAVNGGTASSDIYMSSITDKPTMSFAAPIMDSSGKVVSIITTNLKLEYLWDIVGKVGDENRREGTSGYAFMLDSKGFIIAHPNREKILVENPIDNPDANLRSAVSRMVKGQSGTTGYHYEGQDKYMAYAPCTGFGVYKGHGWSVGVTTPTRELYDPLRNLVHKYIIIFLASSLLVLAISTQLANYLVKPILALKAGASRVGGGDFSQRIEVTTSDEIGELADSFNDMAETLTARDEQINEYTSTLTHMNEELTVKQEELGKANADLTSTNEELRKLEKQKAEFLAMLTHDIKSPLSTIITYTEMISGGLIAQGSDDMDKAIGGIHASGHKVLSLIDNFLVSTSIDAGKLTLNLREMDINRFLDDEMPFLAPKAEKKKLSLAVSKAEGIPHVMADKVNLYRALGNLVSNSIKYTPSGGSIRVASGQRDGRVFISVTDTGIGISGEQLAGLFDMFKRADNTSKVKGFGIGLHIAKAITEMHGGEVTVESEPGVGSTFTIHLPAMASEAQPTDEG